MQFVGLFEVSSTAEMQLFAEEQGCCTVPERSSATFLEEKKPWNKEWNKMVSLSSLISICAPVMGLRMFNSIWGDKKYIFNCLL